ncbi:MAG: sigma-70 family RNA polymerase sigma factor [Candidatus Amoebophilus sp.]
MIDKEVFIRSKAGDKKAQQQIYDKYHKLVYSIVNKMFKRNKTIQYDLVDDLLGVGFIGFTKAMQNFDVDRGIKFSTYCYKAICNEIYRFLAQEKKLENNCGIVSIEEDSYGDSEEDFHSVLPHNEDYDSGMLTEVFKKELEAILNKLPEKQQRIIKLCIGGKTFSEIASVMDLSRARCQKVVSGFRIKFDNRLQAIKYSESSLLKKPTTKEHEDDWGI